MATYYISKYAFSVGIKRAEATPSPYCEGYVDAEGYYSPFKLGKGIHATFEEALAEVEKERIAKIASLKKQIAKIEKATFKEPA